MQNHAAKLKRHITSATFRAHKQISGWLCVCERVCFFFVRSSFVFFIWFRLWYCCWPLSLSLHLCCTLVLFGSLCFSVVYRICSRLFIFCCIKYRAKNFCTHRTHSDTSTTRKRVSERERNTQKFGRENRQRETRRENRPSPDNPTERPTKLPLYAYETYQNQQQHKYIYRII